MLSARYAGSIESAPLGSRGLAAADDCGLGASESRCKTHDASHRIPLTASRTASRPPLLEGVPAKVYLRSPPLRLKGAQQRLMVSMIVVCSPMSCAVDAADCYRRSSVA